MSEQDSTVWSEEAKAAYAAGILDGEGCIRINSYHEGRSYGLAVYVCQAVKGIKLLDFLRDTFGGKGTYSKISAGRFLRGKNAGEDRQPCFTWALHGDAAADFIQLARPYLILKTAQADIAIRFQRMISKFRMKKKHRWSPDLLNEAARMKQQIKGLNWRGDKARLLLDEPPQEPIKKQFKTLFD